MRNKFQDVDKVMTGLGSDCMLNIIMISALIQVKSVSFKLISYLLEQSFTRTARLLYCVWTQ